MLELPLIDIMLVLADADRFWVDLHQLCERVLQTTGDRDGAAHSEVETGELLAGKIGSGVTGSTRFIHPNRENTLGFLAAKKVAHESICLARGGTVSDGNRSHVVFSNEPFQLLRGTVSVVLRRMRVYNIMGEEPAGLIHHGDLAAGADAGVDSEHGDGAGGRREQQILQIIAEDPDGFGIGTLFHLEADLPLN